MADLATGANAESGDWFNYEGYNRLKNHWRMADPRTGVTAPVAGMIVSDSADEKLYHRHAASWNEIIQGDTPLTDDVLIIIGSNNDFSIEYCELTNDAVVFGVPVSPKRGIIYCRTADVAQNFTSLVGASAEVQKHIIDSTRTASFDYGFYGPGIGLLTVPANPLRENMLTNSEIKVWSNSDANKGLGTMNFDSGSVAPVVGETMTGATSGAVGKIIYYTLGGGTWGGGNQTGTIYLGACDGRFNDNEDVNGSVGGANMLTVNMPDTAAGVDLVRNGEFEAGVGGWTPTDCTLASIAGGQVGNCLEMTRTGAINQKATQIIACTVGKIYKLKVYIKSGTSGNEDFNIGVWNGAGWDNSLTGISSGLWVLYSLCFEASVVAPVVHLWKNTATAGTMLFDEVSLYEITPCCTAADNLAFDSWYKASTANIYRQHNDGGTLTKGGSFYSLKLVPSAQYDYIRAFGLIYLNEGFCRQFAGRTITLGSWAKTSVASHLRLNIYDGVTDNYSPYHTGGGGWEWIELTAIVSATPTMIRMNLRCDVAPNFNGSTIVYVSQPMLVFGSSIGAGNYRPRQQEIIQTESIILSNLLNSVVGRSDVPITALNLEADSDGRLPKGLKAIRMFCSANDSGSLATNTYTQFRGLPSSAQFICNLWGRADDTKERVAGWVGGDSNGDISYQVEASGAGTFDFGSVYYIAVQVN